MESRLRKGQIFKRTRDDKQSSRYTWAPSYSCSACPASKTVSGVPRFFGHCWLLTFVHSKLLFVAGASNLVFGHTLPDTNNFFTSVFNTHYKRLCAYAFQFLRDESTSEDVIQDCFVKLWNKRNSIDLSNPTGLLYKMAREASFDYLRKKKTVPLDLANFQNASENAIINEIVYAETLQEIYSLIEELPPKCSEIIKRLYLQGKDNSEIARELNVAESTIRNQKAKALSFLKMHVRKIGTFLF